MKTKTHYPSYTLTFEDALYYRDVDLLRDLLAKGLVPNSRAASGEWLIIEALRSDAFWGTRLLLEAHADVNVRSLAGNTALWEAVPHMKMWWIRDFWKDADLDARSQGGETALHRAVREKKPELIECLLRYGATPDLPNDRGETPLMLCRRLLGATDDAKETAWLRDCEQELSETAREWKQEEYESHLPELKAKGVLKDTPQETFFAVLEKGHTALVRKLLNAGADPNVKLPNNTYPLEYVCCYAPYSDKVEIVELLLWSGANPSRTKGESYTPLMGAALDGDEYTVRSLLSAGANPHRCDESGTNALFSAFVGQNRAVIQLLLDADIDVRAEDDWDASSPLAEALCTYDTEMVALLLERGAHPFTIPDDTHGPVTNMVRAEELAKGAYGGSEEERRAAQENLRLLRRRFPFLEPLDAVEDEQVFNLLNAAAYGLHHEVRCGIFHGASPDVCNSKGESALYLAALYGHEQVVYTLLRYGANPNVTPSPLEAALRGKGKRTERIVRLLLGFGANPNGGEQPMLLLARTPQLIRLLLAAGAQVNASSASPAFVSTALHRHARRGKTACVQALVEAGADTEGRNIHGMTALHLAVDRGNLECVRALLAAGADINARDRHGNTPLMTAFSHRRLPIFRELLQAGADTSIRDCGGRSIDDDIRREEERDSGRVQAFRRRRENLI